MKNSSKKIIFKNKNKPFVFFLVINLVRKIYIFFTHLEGKLLVQVNEV